MTEEINQEEQAEQQSTEQAEGSSEPKSAKCNAVLSLCGKTFHCNQPAGHPGLHMSPKFIKLENFGVFWSTDWFEADLWEVEP